MKTVTIHTLTAMKRAGEKIVALTAYDYSFGALLDRAGIDIVLVGDSLGMVMQGHRSTLPVSLDDMIYHSRCVARGLTRSLLVVDLPFMTYSSPDQALRSAGRLMQEGRAQVVKLEGGAWLAETVSRLTERGMPVCAHLGLTPQSVHQLGGYRVQGRDEAQASRLRADALALADAGASLLVLEAVPAALAKALTEAIAIPTIGIGAGVDCDGQVLVLQDVLGIYPERSPKFAKNFLDGQDSLLAAVRSYAEAVRGRRFPDAEHSFK